MDEVSGHKFLGAGLGGAGLGGAASGAGVPGTDLPLKAMSRGVVDFLFRQLVAGRPAEDNDWRREGMLLGEQPPGAELARRLAETDVDALTPMELFEYVRAAQALADWANSLRERAVDNYCMQGCPRGSAGRI
jgi:hypothetical protein